MKGKNFLKKEGTPTLSKKREREPLSESVKEHRGKNKETNVGKTATKMTATIDFAMQFKKLHESGMQVSNICGCPEFHPSCIPALLRASSKCVVRRPALI